MLEFSNIPQLVSVASSAGHPVTDRHPSIRSIREVHPLRCVRVVDTQSGTSGHPTENGGEEHDE